MNNQLDNLEQSILSQEAASATQPAISLSERHPFLYLTFMSLFAAMGYAWILLFPLTALFLLVYIPYDVYQASNYLDYSIALLEVAVAGFAGWISYEMFKLQVSYPSGRPLTKDEAPDLRTMLDVLCSKYHLPGITRIRIVRDFSVELVRTPANGFPVGYTYSLQIGLPLMQSLNTRCLMAAIEREIVHLSVVHKRPASALYFGRQLWSQYHIAWQKHWSVPSLVMRSFFSWYAPLYKLLAQSACRMQQYYADKKVHSTLRDGTMVHTLLTTNICGHYLENDFWPHLYNKAYRHKQPPYLPYASLDHNLRAKLDDDNAQAWLNAEMEKTSQSSDMPSLRQRLDRLGVHRVSLPPAVTESAARFFLGNNMKTIAGQLDQVWLKTHEFEWQQRFQQGAQQQQRLRSLISQSLQMFLTDETAWELIQLSKRYLGDEQMLPICKQILKNNMRDARIYFDIGRTLLSHADEQGVAALEKAMNLDDSYTVIACQLMTKYFVNIGNSRLAQNYRRRALAYQVNAA